MSYILPYLTLSLSFFLFILSIARIHQEDTKIFKILLFFPSIFFYFWGMLRIDGIDFRNYEIYLNEPKMITDMGFRLAFQFTNYLNINFTEFLAVQAVLTIIAIYQLSKRLDTSFIITFAVFLLHSAIVRDFSQSRIGLAVALLFLGYATSNFMAIIIFRALSVSFHATMMLPVLAFLLVEKIAPLSKKNLIIILSLISFLAIILNQSILPALSLFDPRVEIYMNWKEPGYGQAAESYSAMYFNLFIFLIAAISHKATGDIFYKKQAICAFLGLITFLAFRDFAIFAFRLSHLLTILYPFMIGKIYIDINRARAGYRSKSNSKMFRFSLLLTSLLVLIIGFRPGNDIIIDAIIPVAGL